MTAPEVRAQVSTLRKVEPDADAPVPFAAKPAGRKSQALGDEAAGEIRRIEQRLDELYTEEEALLAERQKLSRIMRASGSSYGE